MDSTLDVSIEPPNMVVEVSVSGFEGLSFTLEYDLKDILEIEVEDGDVEIIDTHWHGIVLDTPDGTEHIDLRDIQEGIEDE